MQKLTHKLLHVSLRAAGGKEGKKHSRVHNLPINYFHKAVTKKAFILS